MLPSSKQSPNVAKRIPRILFLKFGDFILTFAFWLSFCTNENVGTQSKKPCFFTIIFFKIFQKNKSLHRRQNPPKHFSRFGEIPNAKQLFPIVFSTYFGLG
jgi:hypothetical protein